MTIHDYLDKDAQESAPIDFPEVLEVLETEIRYKS